VILSIEDVLGRFDTYRVGVMLAGGLALRSERTPALERAV
jgi:hypothetical protein